MSRRPLMPFASDGRFEDAFLRRYAWLRQRAMALVAGDRARADDLVHDVFVELRLGGVELNDIRDPDAYFARALRNMHISAIRRAARSPVRALSVVEYESLDDLLADTRDNAAESLERCEELHRVCLYACHRKATSKAGSALILRFFYGYSPRSAAAIMRVTTSAFDQWLRTARREARAFLHDPRKLAFMGGNDAWRVAPESWSPSSPDELLASLRRRILASRSGDCLSETEQLEWRAESANSVERDRLAHVVSCHGCLEAVAAQVGLPPPSIDSFDQNTPAGSSTEPGGSGGRQPRRTRPSTPALDISKARQRAILEHRPSSLQILVNGFEVGSQIVGHETVSQTVQASIGEPIGFVEILGDYRVRLLMMTIDPPPMGDVEQHLHRRLEDDRTVAVTVSFARPQPQISVTYDPQISAESAIQAEDFVDEALTPSGVSHGKSPRWRRVHEWWRAREVRSALARAFVVVLVCWLLFGGGASALAAATKSALDLIRAWVTSPAADPKRPPVPQLRDRPLSAPPGPQLEAAVVPPVSRRQRAPLDATTRAVIEMQALRTLQSVDAYLGQEVAFGRLALGKVSIDALVRDADRRDVLSGALASLSPEQRSHIVANIATPIERAQRAAKATVSRHTSESEPPLRSYEVVATRFPAFDQVRAALESEEATPAQRDERAQRFASRVLALSSEASRHSAALRQIGARMSPRVVAAFSAPERENFAAVIHWHAEGFETSMLALGDELGRVSDAPIANPWPSSPDATSSGQTPWLLIERLAELNVMHGYGITRAFSASATGESDGDLVNTSDFKALVVESIAIARQLRAP